jgi:hypothetical protein
MTKNLIIQIKNDVVALQNLMNVVNEEQGSKIFATQTHITVVGPDILYTAVFFIRE